MDFSSTASSSPDIDSSMGGLNGAQVLQQKDQIMDQVRAEMAVLNAQELLNTMNDKCFKKCVTKPGTKLDSSEQTCLAKCMDRYMDAWNIVSKAYHFRVQKETAMQ
ncbi:hypothetical protein MP228_000529 [Amoeboaphelidium protococcarum]|nr:hypothetical protein MP228_000529 [Amoeboaphelidium protococcarum]